MVYAIKAIQSGKVLATIDEDTQTVYIKRGDSEVAIQLTHTGYAVFNGKLEPFKPKVPKR